MIFFNLGLNHDIFLLKKFDASSLSTKSKIPTKTIKTLNNISNLFHDPGSTTILISESDVDSKITAFGDGVPTI